MRVNYSEIALFPESIEKGGIKTNYSELLDDIELWNILNFQLENMENSSRNFNSLSSILKEIRTRINKLKTTSNN